MSRNLDKIRNIGIMAHIDAGKTTVTERILYYTGKTHKIGEVHDGTTVMDYLTEEQQRGITITAAATTCPWKGYTLNLIDTPGHVDFTVEVERSLKVLDGAVAVFDASEGVQAQSETVWRQAQKYGVPCICFINKMDKIGADFEMSVRSLREKLLAHPVLIHLPIGAENDYLGFINLLEMQAFIFTSDKVGASYVTQAIPEQYLEAAQQARHDLIEQAAEFDNHLMEKYINDQPVEAEEICVGLRAGTLQGKIHPILCGSALQSIGARALLDAVVHFLPSPLDRDYLPGYSPGHPDKEIEYQCDPDGPLVAYAFKITVDQHGDLTFTRIYSGTIKTNTKLLNSTRDCKENITKIYQMHAVQKIQCQQAYAGDIVALVGLKNTLTGDTICLPKKPIILQSIKFPEPVMSLSIEPRTAGERSKLAQALNILKREDPTFAANYNSETGQTIISGMGELHLEILQNKLTRDMGLNILVGRPRVAYKETISQLAQGEGKFIKQTGGRGQYGHVVLSVEPFHSESEDEHLVFEDHLTQGVIPKEYVPSIISGIKDAAGSGVLAGFPVIDLKICILDGSFH